MAGPTPRAGIPPLHPLPELRTALTRLLGRRCPGH